MTIYVDRMNRKAIGKTFTAHMMSDTGTQELDAMARKIGLKTAWRQKSGLPTEHYDLTEPKRQLALRYGAVEVSGRDQVRLCVEPRMKSRSAD